MALAVPADRRRRATSPSRRSDRLTLTAVVVTVYHPWPGRPRDVARRAGPAALGILVFSARSPSAGRHGDRPRPGRPTPVSVAFALVVAGLLMYAAFPPAAGWGLGRSPAAAPGDSATACRRRPAAEGWVRLGSGLGLPIVGCWAR